MHKLEMRDVSSENESSASPKSDGSSSASESGAEEAVGGVLFSTMRGPPLC